ncbi:MAG: 4Fe-4S binding protein, partial [Pseudomonadota bacterium]
MSAEQAIKAIPIRIIPESELSNSSHHLAGKIEAFFVHYRKKLVWVHALMFCFFVIVLVVPLFLPDPTENATPLSDFTSFSNYMMWGLWFPLVFLSVIFTGRSWCGLLCPMGAASEWANNIGLQKELPGWLRWEGTPIVS